MKKLIWFGIVLVFVGAAVFTHPSGVQAAIADPWEAITSLTARIVELERRVTNIERFLGMGRGKQIEEPVEFNETKYPYLAKLAPELEGKVAVRYRYQFGYEPEEKIPLPPLMPGQKRYTIVIVLKNIADQPISGVSYGYIVRNPESGDRIGGGAIVYWDEKDKEEGWLLPGAVRKLEGGIQILQPDFVGSTNLNDLEVEVTCHEIYFSSSQIKH